MNKNKIIAKMDKKIIVFILFISLSLFFCDETFANDAIGNWDVNGNFFSGAFAWIFIAIIRVFSLFIVLGVTLIQFTLTPEFMMVITNDGVYTGWQIVRDMLNMFFIFFLLYSAFCTIFQISRYHIKSTWVMIFVMALLVNFSWPITRILIDVSNVAMFHIVGGNNESSTDNALMAQLTSSTGIAEILVAGGNGVTINGDKVVVDVNKDGAFVQLFISIIASALFAFTIGFVAFLLVARMIVLAILLVFASAGFILAAFPSTRGYANEWWSTLTKQLVVGPLVLFGILLASMMLKELNNSGYAAAAKQAASINAVAGNIMTYIVAILMIWACVIAANKVSGQTAGLAMNGAKKARDMVRRGSIGGLKFTGRGLNYGSAVLGNKLADNKNQGIFGKIGRGVGTSLNVARSVPQRIKNKVEDGKDSYKSAVEESRARGLTVGGAGGDKNAIKNIEAKKVAARVKEMEDKATAAIGDGLEKSEGVELAASIKTLVKRDNISDKEMGQLIKELHRLDDDLRKVAMKKITESGKVDASVIDALARVEQKKNNRISLQDARKLAANNVIKGMDNQTIARNSEMLRMGATGDNDVKGALQNRVVNLKVRQQIQSEMKNRDDFNNFNAIVT